MEPEVLPLLRRILGVVFRQDNDRVHVSQTAQVFFNAQQATLLPWQAYSPDMSPIEHVWGFIGRRFARKLVGHTIRMNFGIKSKPSGMPFARITYRDYSMPRCVKALIAQRGRQTKY